ncbi:InlB B-repeat-containing protein, partial [Streptococcus suis]
MPRKKKSFNWYQLSQRFSIRKYHFGAASVLLGVTMLSLGLNQTAQADIITESSLTAADTVVREQPSASQQTEEPASSQVVASAADTQQSQDFESKESALASLSEKEPATELSGEPTPSEEVTSLDGSQTSIAVAEEDTKSGSVSEGLDSVATDNTSLDGSQTSLAVAEEDTKGGSVSDGLDSVATDNTSQNVVSANSSQALQEVKATDVSDNTVKEEFVAHYTTLLDDSQDKADFIKTTLVDVNAVPESVADKLITSMGVDINQATSKEVALALYEALKQLQSNPRDFDVTANRVLATVEAGYPTYVFKVAQDALATPKDNGVYDTQIIIKDGALVNPGTPDLKPSYVFKGWFYDGGDKDGQAVDFTQVIKAQLSNQDPIQIKAKIEREVTVRYQIDGKDYDARVYTLAPDQVQRAKNIPLNLKTPGRVFKYWSKTNENSPYSFDTENLTTDLDLTAVFDNKWVIHFDTQGGTRVPSQTRNYNDNLSLGGVTSERQGYTFSHWSTDKDGQKVADDMPVTSDLTLYAVWSPKDNIRYTILHYLQNANDDDYSLVKTEQTRGSAGSEPTYQDQTKIVDQLEATDKKYFAFADFEKVEKSSETISGDGSTVVKVFYKRKEYSYKFLNGRQTVLEGQARYQQDIRSEFEKADQKIDKGQNVWKGTWEKANRVTPIGLTSMPAENLTFTVQPRERNVFIAKSVIRGEQEKPVKDLRYTSNAGIDFSFDSKSHQIPGFTVVQLDDSRTFVVSKSKNKVLTVSPPTDGKPKVVTYTYVRNVYEANFVLNDGSNTEQTVTIPFDRVVTTPDAFAQYEANKTLIKKDDKEFLFKGWFDNPYASGDPVTFDENLKMPDANLVFYGGWVEKPLTVTIYHDRGETQSTTKKVLLRKTLSEAEDGALTKEEAINLLNPPKGYNTISVDQGGDFEGWFSREMDGDEVLLKPFDFNSPIITDLTLIPVWKQKTVTVTYDYNGGEVTPGKVAPNTDVNLLQLAGTDYVIKSGASLEKEGYQFAGWQSGDTIYRAGDSVLLLKDLNLSAIWSPNVTLDAITTPKEYLEGKEIDQGRVVFPNKVNSQITLGQTPDGLSGLAISKEGDLSGTPIISNWQEREEVRTVDLQVVITADNETKAFTVPITIYRDTDRDGNPDLDTYNKEGVLGDNDDDNDGIPDGEDANPKVKDDLTADVVDNTVVTEKTPVPDNTKVVTPNKPDTKITTKTPVNGLTVDENGNLVGTPNIDNWNDNEEDRDIEIPVTLTKDLPDGSQETKEVTVPVKVNRDTDGDGIIDKNDDDDDNDGIPDGEDANPKVKDDLTADVVD